MMGNTRGLKQLTGWIDPKSDIKPRCKRIRHADHRMTESRIVEEAVRMYLPILEQRYQPVHEVPTQREATVEVPG